MAAVQLKTSCSTNEAAGNKHALLRAARPFLTTCRIVGLVPIVVDANVNAGPEAVTLKRTLATTVHSCTVLLLTLTMLIWMLCCILPMKEYSPAMCAYCVTYVLGFLLPVEAIAADLLCNVSKYGRFLRLIAEFDTTMPPLVGISAESTFEILISKSQFARSCPGETYFPGCIVQTV
ncbi:uncharacterized protein LOC126456524 [Schistocerca serialis cubense]|uniref:uncharacterized protein LOC126456524 n=1 Tax=Schistocerca serialis cubense TaxID=2023355 RepID=UPI00214E8F2F|nr:uncharacterized protein LOC126456524 [Schistocerca serialis cubense]